MSNSTRLPESGAFANAAELYRALHAAAATLPQIPEEMRGLKFNLAARDDDGNTLPHQEFRFHFMADGHRCMFKLVASFNHRLLDMAETVRKNWALYGGGPKPAELKPARRVTGASWSPTMVQVWREQIEIGQHADATRMALEKLGGRFYMGSTGPLAFVAPKAVEGMPAELASMRRCDGKWVVMDTVSGVALGSIGRETRASAEKHAMLQWGGRTDEQKATALRRARADNTGSQSDAMAAWCEAHGVDMADMPAAPADILAPADDAPLADAPQNPALAEAAPELAPSIFAPGVAPCQSTDAVVDTPCPGNQNQNSGHRYALVNRPADMGTLPRGLAYELESRPAPGQPHHDMARHGIIVAPRELTHAELRAFDLAPLAEGAAFEMLAKSVASPMRDYASGYVDMARDDASSFADTVRHDARRVDGIAYSIGDDAAFVARVLEILQGVVRNVTPCPVIPKENSAPIAQAESPAPATPNALTEARTNATLAKIISEGGKLMTRREWVESKVAEGLRTRTTQENKIKPMSRMAFFRANNEEQRAHDRRVAAAGKKDVYSIGGYEVTKIEHDYAQALTLKAESASRRQDPAEAAPASTPPLSTNQPGVLPAQSTPAPADAHPLPGEFEGEPASDAPAQTAAVEELPAPSVATPIRGIQGNAPMQLAGRGNGTSQRAILAAHMAGSALRQASQSSRLKPYAYRSAIRAATWPQGQSTGMAGSVNLATLCAYGWAPPASIYQAATMARGVKPEAFSASARPPPRQPFQTIAA